MRAGRGQLLRALAVVALLGASVAAAPTASADGTGRRDAHRDVLVSDDPGADGGSRLDPQETRDDIGRLRAWHGARTLVVATGIGSLTAWDTTWQLRVATSKGEVYDIGRSTSSADESAGPEVWMLRDGRRTTCAGLVVRRTRAGVRAEVPRPCLGSPWRLRVGVQVTSVFPLPDGPPWERVVVDDALLDGRATPRRPRLGSWIAAGDPTRQEQQ